MNRKAIIFFATVCGFLWVTAQMILLRLSRDTAGGSSGPLLHIAGLALLGAAAGVLGAARWLARWTELRKDGGGLSPLRCVGLLLIAWAVLFYFSIAAFAEARVELRPLSSYIFIAATLLTSAVLASLLPLLAQFGDAPRQDPALLMARLIGAALVGAASAPLLIGVVLSEQVGTDRIVLYVCAGIAVIGAAAHLAELSGRTLLPAGVVAGIVSIMALGHAHLFRPRPGMPGLTFMGVTSVQNSPATRLLHVTWYDPGRKWSASRSRPAPASQPRQ